MLNLPENFNNKTRNLFVVEREFDFSDFDSYSGDKESLLEKMKQDMRERTVMQAMPRLTDGKKYLLKMLDFEVDYSTFKGKGISYRVELFVFLVNLHEAGIGELVIYNFHPSDYSHEVVTEEGKRFVYVDKLNEDDIWKRVN